MQKIILFFLLLFIFSCKSRETKPEEEPMEAKTPVTVTTISIGPMTEYIDLNATSTFLQKWFVKANITGYLQTANVQLNQYVTKGDVLYTIKTKEAKSIGNSISILDSTLKFSGVNKITADAGDLFHRLIIRQVIMCRTGNSSLLSQIPEVLFFYWICRMSYDLI